MLIPTPILPLPTLGHNIYGKVEYLHPSGSMKHRSIPAFIEAQLRGGSILAGARIAIRSAGAAAITTAWTATRHNLRCTAVLPETAPAQSARILRWYGATVHCVSNARAVELMRELKSSADTFVLEQASEPALIQHYRPVAAEILEALPSAACITVGVGTGLSIMGICAEVRDRSTKTAVMGVEPLEAPLASGGAWQPHRIYGLAPPRERPLLDTQRLAGIENIASDHAWEIARFVAAREGLFIGPSAGATLAAAMRLAQREQSKPIVAVLACSMHEYLDAERH